MQINEQDQLLQKCIKTLNDEEIQGYQELMKCLDKKTAEKVLITGEKFRVSSAINGTWFIRILPQVARSLRSTQLEDWLGEAFRVARGNWESSLAFLRYHEKNLKQIGQRSYLGWIKLGSVLGRFTIEDTLWFFKYGGDLLEGLSEAQKLKIINFSLETVESSWFTALASYKVLPSVFKDNSLSVVDKTLKFGKQILQQSRDVAAEYFLALPQFLTDVDSAYLDNWVQIAGSVTSNDKSSAILASYFIHSPKIFRNRQKEDLPTAIIEWVNWGNSLANLDQSLAVRFFEKTDLINKKLCWEDFGKLVDLIVRVYQKHNLESALSLINVATEVLAELDIKETEDWVEYGLVSQKTEKMKAYFLLKSQESRDALGRFRKGLLLESVKKVLLFFCEGLTGRQVKIRSYADLPSKIHEDRKLFCSVDTRRVYLPPIIKVSSNSQSNLNLYKAMLMHQFARCEFGTLDLSKDLYAELVDNKELGIVFQIVEGCRVDYLAQKSYPGLTKLFSEVILSNIVEELFADKIEYHSVGIKKIIDEYWQKVQLTGASADETLVIARRILDEAGNQYLALDDINFPEYWGKLQYDLIYVSKVLDEELSQEGKQAEKGPKTKLKVGGFNPHNEFNLWLKKLLANFLEDEENSYRLIAYYDEWDRTLSDFKKDWCKVREILLKPSTSRFVDQTLTENYGMINTLKRYFGMLRPDRFKRFRRQDDGDEIDIDAVIEAMVERQAGTSTTGGFYIRRDKRERDVAVGFLLDLSYSTSEVIPNSNKTLLDLEQEAVIVMSEALEVLGDKYGIFGFSSDSREKINFYVLKDFAEVFTKEVKQRFGGLKSYGMTRLAAAVRHATTKLIEIKAAIKILIILSDGRPFDFDYHSGVNREYEKFYAEEDTRMSLREAKMKGINPFCITVDTHSREYMEYIYGNVNYIIIDNVNDLPYKLTETYKNLTS